MNRRREKGVLAKFWKERTGILGSFKGALSKTRKIRGVVLIGKRKGNQRGRRENAWNDEIDLKRARRKRKSSVSQTWERKGTIEICPATAINNQ